MQAPPHPQRPVRRQHLCVLLGAYAVGGGVASFLGWAVDLPRLTDWIGSGISIQPNATVCVAMSGLALIALALGRSRVGAALGLLVAALAGATLLQWVAGISLGIDSALMFGREWGRVGVIYPGRMGPPGSLSLTLIGVALVLSGQRSANVRRRAPQVALVTFGLSLLSIIGHLYGADVLYMMPRLTIIAAQTATFTMAVSAGIVALHPDRVPMRWLVSETAVGEIARRAIPTVVLAPIVLGWLRLLGQRAGMYDTPFGIALMALGLIAVFGAVLWRGLAAISRHESALLAAEARTQLAITAGDAATWDLDLVTGVNTWSESHFHMLGYVASPNREPTKDMWESSVVEDDLPALRVEWRRARQARDMFRTEYRLRRADGSVLWARAAGRFFYDDAGRAVRFVGVQFDVTEEQQALEVLRESDRRKDEFLAMLAHELRNPLAPVRNAVQVLQLKEASVPEVRWARDVIDRQLQQLTRLTDDLLDVSRFTRGHIELKRERIELGVVVQDAIEGSKPLLDQYGHGLFVALPPQTIVLDADRVRLAQVFCNLLNNAARYTPRGGRIYLSAALDGREVEVSVRDNGVGIAPDLLPRVFEMFMQADRSSERSQGGLGIGLTLVRRLVELHGGHVEALSDGPGKGAEFRVRLPVRPQTVAATPTAALPGNAAVAQAALRVLVVDDNRDAAESLALLLQMVGHDTRTAFDGTAAVQVAQEYRPDVVMMDIGLPGMNGHDAARAIRREPWGAAMVLIALTGWGQDDDRLRSVAAGFDHHFVKPVMPEVLMDVLATVATQKPQPVAEN